jgi:hypothetical protein
MTHFHTPSKDSAKPLTNGESKTATKSAVKRLKPKRRTARLRRHALRDEQGAPTPERLKFAEGHVEIGDDAQGTRVYTLRDSPLERLSARGGIDPREYSALMKFKQHWYHAGLQPALGGVDLARVFASDPASFSGMAKTERQVFHRQRYREAVQHIGLRAALVVERVVCAEQTLEMAGLALNWRTPAQARAAATELLRDAGYRLAQFWGVG